MKKILTSAVAVICAASLGLSLAGCAPEEADAGQASAYVSVDINPSIELTLDENGKVLSAVGANEDGQVLLYGEEGIVGEDAETAISKIITLSVEMGYLDDDNAVVSTSAVVASGSADDVLGSINASITSTAQGLGLSVECSGQAPFSVDRRLENLKDRYPDNAAIQALTPAQFSLVVSAAEAGHISVEAAAQLSTQELLDRVSAAHEAALDYATEAYNRAKSAAQGAYDKAVSAAVDGIYATYYTAHHPLNAYYGLAYQGYKAGATAVQVVADTLYYAENAYSSELTEAQISATAAALGLGADEVDVLKDADGKITLDSVEAYADKLFKNSAPAEVVEARDKLTQALNSAENDIRGRIAQASADYKEDLESFKSNMDGIKQSISALSPLVPEAVKEQLNAIIDDFAFISEEVNNIFTDGVITSDEVSALADQLSSKADSALEKIRADLTEEELAEVEELREKALSAIESAKQQMEKLISDAEEQARAKLSELKAARNSG